MIYFVNESVESFFDDCSSFEISVLVISKPTSTNPILASAVCGELYKQDKRDQLES